MDGKINLYTHQVISSRVTPHKTKPVAFSSNEGREICINLHKLKKSYSNLQ